MIHYHGGPITPETAAIRVWRGRHAFVSFACLQQLETAAGVAQSFAIDNGAFTFWKQGKAAAWPAYHHFCQKWLRHPACDWAVIPDVIDGTEDENDRLIDEWRRAMSGFSIGAGVPVWHLHEGLDRLERLCLSWPRVALGSSGQYAAIGGPRWWTRIAEAMNAVTDRDGRPLCKLHGLRMLDPDVFSRLPFASADSTNVGQNIGIDSRWTGAYSPANKETRAQVLAERIESVNSAEVWRRQPIQLEHEATA